MRDTCCAQSMILERSLSFSEVSATGENARFRITVLVCFGSIWFLVGHGFKPLSLLMCPCHKKLRI